MNFNLTYLIVTFTLFCSLFFVSFAQNSTIDKLEKRINELEKRVTLLEQKLADNKKPVTTNSKKYKDKPNWRRLQKGMTTSEIEAILGEPLTIDVSGIFTYWYYSKNHLHSYVNFYEGVVYGWTEPE